MKPITDNIFAEKYLPPLDKGMDYIARSFTDEVIYNIAIGPIRSGKTSDNIVAFCMHVEMGMDSLHYTVATTESTAKTILWDNDGLGIKYYPDWQARTEWVDGKPVKIPQRIFEGKYKNRDALILYPLPYENKPVKYIVAYGGDKENSFKAFRGTSAGTVIATETNLLHPNTIQEYTARVGNSSHKKIFEDLNPGNPKQWVKTNRIDYLRQSQPNAVNIQNRTLEDNPALSQRRRNEIKAMYPVGSVFYRNLILGEWVAAEGLIYTFDDEKNIIDGYNVIDYGSYIIIADPGVNHSATHFTVQAITRDRKYLDTLEEYNHKNADKTNLGIKMPIDYAKDFIQFIHDAIRIFGKAPAAVMSDLDLTFIREFERLKYDNNLGGINLRSKFLKEKIKDRMMMDINLLYTGRKRINKKCVKTIEAYQTAMYDPKEEIKGNYVRLDDPQAGTSIDPIDTNEYGATYYRIELNEWRGDSK